MKRSDRSSILHETIAQWPLQVIDIPKAKITLNYEGKKTVAECIATVPDAILLEVKSYGQIGFHDDPNLLIHGDNLLGLKALVTKCGLKGKIRQVYIDPPFATGLEFRSGNGRVATISSGNGDNLAYSDKMVGSEYLEFIRERLIFLRDLLSDDGTIFVHNDYKVGHYIKILMDEIFGEKHFINDITRIKCNPKNFSRKGFGNIKDLILFYSKSENFLWNEPRVEMTKEDIERLFPKIDSGGRRYTTTPLHAPGETSNGATGQPWNGLFPPSGRHWRVPPKELTRLDKMNLIEWSSTGNPRKKIFAEEVLSKGKKLQDLWELKDPPYPRYPTEKNFELLKRIINATSDPGDIVLDCFSGSGTTLLAAEMLGRRWIGIDNSVLAIQATIKKLREVPNLSEFTVYECEAIDKKLHKGTNQ